MADDTTTQDEQTTAPWDDDLAAAFEDEDLRDKVSAFLGEKVQPYVTQLEQKSKPNRDAQRLWEGFEESPVDTSLAVIGELYGADIRDRFAELLQGGASPEQAAAQVETETQVDVTDTTAAEGDTDKQKITFEDLPPEVQNAVAAQEQERQREAYYGEVERIKKEHADALPKGEDEQPQLNVDLFHPFVVAAGGDFDAAFEAFSKFTDEAKAEFGLKVPGTEEVEEAAPTTINSETRDAGQTPPQKEEYPDLDTAIDAFFDEQKAPPPTVGAA